MKHDKNFANRFNCPLNNETWQEHCELTQLKLTQMPLKQWNTTRTLRTHLDRVEATRHSSILHLYVWGRVCELALDVGARALVALVLPTHLQGEPPGVLHVRGREDGGNHLVHHGHNSKQRRRRNCSATWWLHVSLVNVGTTVNRRWSSTGQWTWHFVWTRSSWKQERNEAVGETGKLKK